MRKKIKIQEDLVHKFWKKYEEADFLKRDELLKPLVKNFMPMANIKDEKMRQHLLKTYLQSYFDDLIEYFQCKKLKKQGYLSKLWNIL